MSKTASGIITALIVLVYFGLVYIFHPALNIHAVSFWVFGLITIAAIAGIMAVWTDGFYDNEGLVVIMLWIGVAALVVPLLLAVISSPACSAGALSSQIEPAESTFEEHADDLQVKAIPLMDTESAKLFGNRELGGLADVVSQFDDDPNYHQIDYNGTPTKVSAVDYAGFFRWTANNQKGAPGYVSVDPIDQSADYVALDEQGYGNLLYTDGAFFNEDISRHVQFQYPTYVLGENRFELDDEGHPYYVTKFYEFATIGFFGSDTAGVIVTDPTNGESTEYKVSDIPEWVDDVYDGDLILRQATDHWMLGNGFLNSLFAKDGCRKTSNDFGYVDIDGHIWVYTGVTSANDDSSNIGFLLVSEQTKESYFIPMSAADEESAMRSAEGQVQQYGYEASWPSLVSIDGQPTYVMVLKDASGIVRMFSMVNAQNYNVVACESTLDAVKASYEKRMGENGIKFAKDAQDMPNVFADGEDAEGTDADNTEEPFKATVTKVVFADEDGDTYVWMACDDGIVYKARFADHAAYLMGIEEGCVIEGDGQANSDATVTVVKFSQEASAGESSGSAEEKQAE